MPMAAPQASWALLNLIALFLTAATAAGMVLTMRRKDEDEELREGGNAEDGQEEMKAGKLLGLIPAAGSAVLFWLTENMHNPMVLTDEWTVAMIMILVIEAGLALMTRRDEKAEQVQAG